MAAKNKKSNESVALSVLAIAVGMLGLAYASVPLYNLFCRVTGFGGTTQESSVIPEEIYSREITVRFNSDTSPDIPWKFKPEQNQVKVKVGENKLIFFTAENYSDKDSTGTAIYNVTPHKVGMYFAKVQCFCFERQLIKAGEKATFPVSFYVDPEILNDKNMDDVNTITLSYTFFKAKD